MNPEIYLHAPNSPRLGTGGRFTTKYRTILTLEMQGNTKRKIAELMGMTEGRISIITNSPEYIAEREKILAGYDQDFLNLKGKVMKALDDGLTASTPMSERLRAADMWFKAAGYGAHAPVKTADVSNVTAEDVVKLLLQKARREQGDIIDVPVNDEDLQCAAE